MLMIEGSIVSDPVEALQTLKEKVYDHDRFTMEEYLEFLSQSIWKFHSLGLTIQGKTIEEKCASCLEQLVHYGLVTLEN